MRHPLQDASGLDLIVGNGMLATPSYPFIFLAEKSPFVLFLSSLGEACSLSSTSETPTRNMHRIFVPQRGVPPWATNDVLSIAYPIDTCQEQQKLAF